MNDTPATYIKPEVPEYQGNPLIEALPPIRGVLDAARLIRQSPDLPGSEIHLDSSIRLHCLNRITRVVQPFLLHLNLEQSLSILIRSGYLGRNPFNASTVRQLHSISSERQVPFASTANSFCVFGLSGMGKSTAILSILNTYPQTIRHTAYQGQVFPQAQVVWLKIDCPFDGSIKALCLSFFSALADAIGDESIRQINTRIGAAQLIQKMKQLASTYYLGALIIDEIQTLANSRAGKNNILNFFINLINDIGIPIVFIGNNSAMKLMSGTLRNARRICGSGMLIFDRFTEGDPEWDALVEKLWKYQWCEPSTELTPALKRTIYHLTQGIPDFLVKLIILAQRRVIGTGDETIQEETLNLVSETSMAPLKPALEALRANDYKANEYFEDLLPAREVIEAMMFYQPVNTNKLLDLISAQEDILTDSPPEKTKPSPPRTPRSTRKSGKTPIDMTDWECSDVFEFSSSSSKK